MSGKKRAEVVEALSATVAMLDRIRSATLDRSRRLLQGRLDRAAVELAKARDLAGEAALAMAAPGFAASAESRANELRLQVGIDLRMAEKILADAGAARAECVSAAAGFDAELAKALKLEKEASDRLHAGDGLLADSQWHREEDFERARVAFVAAETANRMVRALQAACAAADRLADEAVEAVAKVHTAGRLLREVASGQTARIAAERVADDARRAELAGALDELNALAQEVPADYAANCASGSEALPDEAAALAAAITADIANSHPAVLPEVMGRLEKARLLTARLGGALREVESNREAAARRRRLADAIMRALGEMHFDVSFDPGDRDRSCRISGQTPRPDGDGDFDIALPLDGSLDFEVADLPGDGRSCRRAVTALAERLEAHGIFWETADWGHAATPAEREALSARPETDRAKEKQRDRREQP